MGGFSTGYSGNNVNLAASSDVPSGGVDPFFLDLMQRAMRRKLREERGPMARGAGSSQPVVRRAPEPSRGPQRMEHPYDKYGPRPKDFGRWQMGSRGGWGHFVDPANIPAGLQDKIMGGFHGEMANWDSSNPQITGPQQWGTGKYRHSGGVSMPSQIREEPEDPEAHGGGVEFEKERFRAARSRSDLEAAQRSALASLPALRS